VGSSRVRPVECGAADYSLDTAVVDLEAVVNALGVPRFDLLAHVSPCHAAIAFAARRPDRVRRLALWNPGRPGWSARAANFADLPDIARTHYREYMELAALRLFGWEHAAAAQRWLKKMLEHFTHETWERLMTQMERVDATPEASNVLAPTLIVIDHTAASGIGAAETEQYRRRLTALLPNAELVVIKGDDSMPVQAGLAPGYVDASSLMPEMPFLPSPILAAPTWECRPCCLRTSWAIRR